MKRIQCLQQPMKNESFAHNDAHKLNLFLLLYMLFIEKNSGYYNSFAKAQSLN